MEVRSSLRPIPLSAGGVRYFEFELAPYIINYPLGAVMKTLLLKWLKETNFVRRLIGDWTVTRCHENVSQCWRSGEEGSRTEAEGT